MTGITRTFDAAFYTGTASADAGAGTKYDVVLGGRPYMIDWQPPDSGMAFRHKTMPLLQRYYLTAESGNIGEQTLNPEDYWRRSSDDWSSGAGQKYNDRQNSNRGQYRTSSGIDPWTIGEIGLLPDTQRLLASVNNVRIVNAGPAGTSRLYILDGDTLKYATDLTGTTTTVTATGGDVALSGAVSVASDGFTVYVADGTRVHYTTFSSSNYQKYHTADHIRTLVRTVKGRVFTAAANVLYTNAGAAGSAVETALLTHPNPDFTWVDVVGGPAAIYFAGHSGDQSFVYSTQVVSDGTNLSVPAVAAELPKGELVLSLGEYLGVLLIGTTAGVRTAIIDSSGNLNLQALLPLDGSTQLAFEGQDRFVWCGGLAGLNRIDLSVFNGNVPAYAPDLVAANPTPAANVVQSIVSFGYGPSSVRVFSINGGGVWYQTGDLVASGTINQGWWNYALPDKKQAVKLSLQYLGGGGTITVATAADFSSTYMQAGGVITTVATDVATNAVLPTGNTEGVLHEAQLTLTRDLSDHTSGPTITRFTLMSNPQPQRRVTIMLPLLLHHELSSRSQDTLTIDPAFERAQLDAWCQSNQIISYQDAASTFAVTIDDYDWLAYGEVDPQLRALEGTIGLLLKVIG